jgi:hypothetical protein
MDQKCVKCGHSRRSHSRNGCVETIDMRTGKECPCRVKYMDQGMFK